MLCEQIMACLVRRFGRKFPGGHPVLPLLVKYSVAMVNRCRRGPDGKTCTMFETLGRREATERVDFTFLNVVSARPWDGPKSAKDVRVVLPDVSSLAAMAEAEALGRTRRLYISKADILLTKGCLGCRSFAEGKRA